MTDEQSPEPAKLSADRSNALLTIAFAALADRAGGSLLITDKEMLAAVELAPRFRCRLQDGDGLRLWIEPQETKVPNAD